MTSPYRTEEIADAVLVSARREGIPLEEVSVRADDVARLWTVEATLSGRGHRRAVFPFASPAGIYTPTELAQRFLGGWPFD